MKFIQFFVVFLFSAIAAHAIIIDTTEIYNGTLTRKRVEKNADGSTVKVDYLYPNGNIETEYFIEDNKAVRWIAYDEKGVKIVEWEDPEPKENKRRFGFIATLGLTAVLLSVLCLSIKKRLGYDHSYYFVLLLSVVSTILFFCLPGRLIGEGLIINILSSLFFISPLFLLALSVSNLAGKRKIPTLLSIVGIAYSLMFLFYIVVGACVAGAGLIG